MATLRLDLGAGQRPTEGFKSVDLVGEPDYKVDLFEYPWPFKDKSVREIVSNHLVEHIPHWRPGYDRDGFWMFFNEVHRICVKGATVTLTCPQFKNDRAFWDPSHTRYIHDISFSYLNQEWLKMQGLDHYPVTANFDVTGWYDNIPDHIMNRTQEMQDQAHLHYWNTKGDLTVVLTAIK